MVAGVSLVERTLTAIPGIEQLQIVQPAIDQIVLNVVRAPDFTPATEQALRAKMSELDFHPDVIMTFGEPMSDHLLGLRLKRRLGLPWLAHFSDPWADMSFRKRQVLANIVNRRLEAEVIQCADRIVFTSPETEALVMRKYPESLRAKCRVLAHSFDERLYPDPGTPSGGASGPATSSDAGLAGPG